MSNTIIMYENGKAVGGEGHPTNADEITFNNEDTDLVAEEVESAIKEVNAKFDKGSVSVTADGVKTMGTLLNELFALIDNTKVSPNATITRDGDVYHVNGRGATQYYFEKILCDGAALYVNSIIINANASRWHYNACTFSSGVWTNRNDTSNVPTNGTTYTLHY